MLSVCSLKIFITIPVSRVSRRLSCGLLSVCSLKIFITIEEVHTNAVHPLWFAFGLFFEDIYYNFTFNFASITGLWFAFGLFFEDIYYNS